MANKVFWAVLAIPAVDGEAFQAFLDVAAVCGATNCYRIIQPYTRTDMARNYIAKKFLKYTDNDDDVLVMLDVDHEHPRDIVPRLVQRITETVEVVGALAFRRSEPHDPCFFRRNEGALDLLTSFSGELEKGLCVGTGAVAIRRSVFRKLQEAGIRWPWFRYTYNEDSDIQRTEDFEFSLLCEKIGVSHYVDTSFYTPHQAKRLIGPEDWFNFLREAEKNPKAVEEKFKVFGFSVTPHGNNGKSEPVAQHV